jgi:hypothetical protein
MKLLDRGISVYNKTKFVFIILASLIIYKYS